MSEPAYPLNAPTGLTLSQYAAWIGEAMRRVPELWNAWVIAELSDVRVNGGHCYMELVEKNAAGQTVAKMRATIWASTFYPLRKKFLAATGREVATGMKVLLRGSASHHPLYGLSFNIVDIDPSFTLGDIERLRREILQRLTREGIIDNNKKQHLPLAPQRVAVISAPGAAGYGDFMNHLLGNSEKYVFYTHLFQAVMQGDRTSSSVRAALEMVEQTIDLWDCVVIIRGGGATTDLNGFDDYELAKAVALCSLPVIVGIGHERDRTVLDEIAHTRMKTPTAVAGFLVDSLREAETRAASLTDFIARYSTDRIKGETQRLANLEATVPALASARIAAASSLLDRELTRIPVLVSSRLERASSRLDRISDLLRQVSSNRTVRAADRLIQLENLFSMAAVNVLNRASERVRSLESLVNVLSPSNTLSRGYSITRVGGKAVTDVGQLPPGTRFTTTLLNGTVEAEVKQ
ncbi:MAG: exodeoxyribonuclease VII large subunit [Muribaculaceae bacterium]|nr:exodeoxyribonuclease VII large subunit [Muribaculaceae bacterium]MDE6755042.1 exodeoxyribonuclease VII large subunit [Muribaculaceae bacterium]